MLWVFQHLSLLPFRLPLLAHASRLSLYFFQKFLTRRPKQAEIKIGHLRQFHARPLQIFLNNASHQRIKSNGWGRIHGTKSSIWKRCKRLGSQQEWRLSHLPKKFFRLILWAIDSFYRLFLMMKTAASKKNAYIKCKITQMLAKLQYIISKFLAN